MAFEVTTVRRLARTGETCSCGGRTRQQKHLEHRSKESGVEEELIAAAAARSGVPVKDGTATIADAQGAQASLTELILWSTS